jgi:hypothetical protein
VKPAVHQYEDKLLEFAYGELTGTEASAVEAHVTGCARCTQALDEIRSVRMTMGKLPQVEAPDAGLESLFAYAEQAARRNADGPAGEAPWWRRLVAPLAGVMALGLVAVVGVKVSEESNGELMPAPTKVAAEKAEAYDEGRAPADAVAQAPTPTPAPVVAAAPEPAPAAASGPGGLADKLNKDAPAKPMKKGGAKAAEADDYDSAFGGDNESKNNAQQAYGMTNRLGETAAPERKNPDLGGDLSKAAKLSEKRRAEAKPVDKKAEKQEELSADYGNARGGYVQSKAKPAAPPPPPAQVAQPAPAPAKSGAGGFGLSTGGGRAQKEQVANIDEPEAVAAPRGKTVSGGVPSASAPAQAMERSSRDDSKEEAKQAVAPKDVDRLLADARAQHSRNNLTQEIALAQEALNQGAKGNQRAEALARICDALDALGQESKADAYCQALLTEFRNSAVAQRVAQRRNSPSMNPAPSSDMKRAKKSAPAEADSEKAEPAVKKNAASEAAY